MANPTGLLQEFLAQRVQDLRRRAKLKLSKNKGRNVLLRTEVKLHLPRSKSGCGWFLNSAKYRVLTLPCRLSSGKGAMEEIQTRWFGYVSALGDEGTWRYWIPEPLYVLWQKYFI